MSAVKYYEVPPLMFPLMFPDIAQRIPPEFLGYAAQTPGFVVRVAPDRSRVSICLQSEPWIENEWK